jgi:hypothetical protein
MLAMPPMNARLFLLETLPKAAVGAEIGVFGGDFSAYLLKVAEPLVLHLIDPWVSVADPLRRWSLYGAGVRSQADMDQLHADVIGRFGGEIAGGRVVVHRAPSSAALAAMPDRSLDWIYIDGDHSYEAVIADLRLGLAKVKPGGFICGDDYLPGGWWKGGVIRAVHDFLHEAQPRVRIKLVLDTQYMLSVVD